MFNHCFDWRLLIERRGNLQIKNWFIFQLDFVALSEL